MKHPIMDPAVKAAFAAFPVAARPGLMAIRDLIFDVAATTRGVGPILETLKWGAPAYLTAESRSGSTLRLGATQDGRFALYAHCQTTIISDFRLLFPEAFTYEGNRAIWFHADDSIDADAISMLVRAAQTYHLKN